MAESIHSIEANLQNFPEQVLAASRTVPVLVDFWAAWCAPCRSLMPVLQQLAGEYQGKFLLAKVNSDEQQELAARYGVRSLPTVLVIRHGEVVDSFVGAQPEGTIRRLIERHIERPSDRLRAEARDCLASGDTVRARELLETARRADPDNAAIPLDLARLALRENDGASAQALLDALPLDARQAAETQPLLAHARLLRELDGAPDAHTLEQRRAQDGDNLETRYLLALRRLLEDAPEPGMEDLLEILRRDRKFRDDGARKALLAAFDLFADQPELVNRFRRGLASALH